MHVDAIADPWELDGIRSWLAELLDPVEWVLVSPLARCDFPPLESSSSLARRTTSPARLTSGCRSTGRIANASPFPQAVRCLSPTNPTCAAFRRSRSPERSPLGHLTDAEARSAVLRDDHGESENRCRGAQWFGSSEEDARAGAGIASPRGGAARPPPCDRRKEAPSPLPGRGDRARSRAQARPHSSSIKNHGISVGSSVGARLRGAAPKACLGREGRIQVRGSLSCIRPEAFEGAQVPAARRRLRHDPDGRADDVQGRGRDADGRLGRQRGACARESRKARPDPRGCGDARSGRVRIVREGSRGCSDAAHSGAASRRRDAGRSGQSDRCRCEWTYRQAVRFAEADRTGEADPGEPEDHACGGGRCRCRRTDQTRGGPRSSCGAEALPRRGVWRRRGGAKTGRARVAATHARSTARRARNEATSAGSETANPERVWQHADDGPFTYCARHETGSSDPATGSAASRTSATGRATVATACAGSRRCATPAARGGASAHRTSVAPTGAARRPSGAANRGVGQGDARTGKAGGPPATTARSSAGANARRRPSHGSRRNRRGDGFGSSTFAPGSVSRGAAAVAVRGAGWQERRWRWR